MDTPESNRALAIRINEEIWNNRQYDHLRDFSTMTSSRTTRRTQSSAGPTVRESVERSHAPFSDYHEAVNTIVTDAEHAVLHITITGRQTGDWGP